MKIVKIFFRIIVALFILLLILLILFGMLMVWKGTIGALDYIFERHPDLFTYFVAILVGLIMIVIGKNTIKILLCDKN
jgi:hypothetical protein